MNIKLVEPDETNFQSTCTAVTLYINPLTFIGCDISGFHHAVRPSLFWDVVWPKFITDISGQHTGPCNSPYSTRSILLPTLAADCSKIQDIET
jgi:hypothetical protein